MKIRVDLSDTKSKKSTHPVEKARGIKHITEVLNIILKIREAYVHFVSNTKDSDIGKWWLRQCQENKKGENHNRNKQKHQWRWRQRWQHEWKHQKEQGHSYHDYDRLDDKIPQHISKFAPAIDNNSPSQSKPIYGSISCIAMPSWIELMHRHRPWLKLHP
nr:hypothetical protein CFP56_29726 [Quercus suber]